MKKLVLLLLPIFGLSQYTGRVGINTTTPKATLQVKGNVMIEASTGMVSAASFSGGNSGQCPNFLKNQSSGYNVHFSSPSSVPNPNNALTIQGKNFAPSAAFITGNTYFYSWSNTTGQSININNLTVNFSGLICNYN